MIGFRPSCRMNGLKYVLLGLSLAFAMMLGI
jgi:hypothetical protein